MHPRAEHVWVTDVQVWGDVQAPGLLLGWRQTRQGAWEGWCVVAHLGPQESGPYVPAGVGRSCVDQATRTRRAGPRVTLRTAVTDGTSSAEQPH
ncbi:MAG: hypothetical protein CMH83_19370 [Nocardioides sp.]|nr:hypothetical protein [Nocardioides sp.]